MSQTIRITLVATLSDALLAKIGARAERNCSEFAEIKPIAEALSSVPGAPSLRPVLPSVEQHRDALIVQQAMHTAAEAVGGFQAAYVTGDTTGRLERNRGFMRLTDDDSPSSLAIELADCDTDPRQFWNPPATAQGAQRRAEAEQRQHSAGAHVEAAAAAQGFGLEPITAETPDLDEDTLAALYVPRPVDPRQEPLAGVPEPEPSCVEADTAATADTSTSSDCSAGFE
ncbi:hypothetical protein [Lysobacter sp. Hz 25]|uniref:hypothetical protein n=1 Tax=Lysobacter sp. Hz 25 TaxID=3383698 RepID=UPI0038D3BB3C